MRLLVHNNKSLPPSKAGIGRRLNTHRFTDIIAQRIISIVNHLLIDCVMSQTIPIGPATLSIASSLSCGVSGLNIFFTNIQRPENVSLI
jgi:hypothetical protein